MNKYAEVKLSTLGANELEKMACAEENVAIKHMLRALRSLQLEYLRDAEFYIIEAIVEAANKN